jgi:hypothetical protein
METSEIIKKDLRNWIKTQHGTAGWEKKLENFVLKVYEKGKIIGFENTKL